MENRILYDKREPESTTGVQEKDKTGTLNAGEGSGTQGGRNEETPRFQRVVVTGSPDDGRTRVEYKVVGLSPSDTHDGVQTKVGYRFDLLPAGALFAAAEVMQEGAEKGYEEDGWKELTTNELLNHAMGHIVGYLNGDRQEDHLSHAIVRVMMAWQTRLETGS